jgi:hypothetical protein
MKITTNQIYQDDIETPREFVESLVRSALSNRVCYDRPIKEIDIKLGDVNIFDFTMTYEEKIKLYNIGYST